ncbi:MAG TPA: hypothetical protein VGF48_13935 [Thermoanaerobaculia bacterium]|jgi:hypothetical protein
MTVSIAPGSCTSFGNRQVHSAGRAKNTVRMDQHVEPSVERAAILRFPSVEPDGGDGESAPLGLPQCLRDLDDAIREAISACPTARAQFDTLRIAHDYDVDVVLDLLVGLHKRPSAYTAEREGSPEKVLYSVKLYGEAGRDQQIRAARRGHGFVLLFTWSSSTVCTNIFHSEEFRRSDVLGQKVTVSMPEYRNTADYEPAFVPAHETTSTCDMFGRPKSSTTPDGKI